MISSCEIFSSFARRKLFLPFLFSETQKFSGPNPKRLNVFSLPPIQIVQQADRNTTLKGHWSIFSRNFPRAVVSVYVTEEGRTMSHCASGQLYNALSQGEIPSSPQLLNSYAPQPRTDMPCNFLT